MGRKTNVGFLILVLFTALSFVFYYQISFGKIPFNGNLLVAFFPPWKYIVPFKFMGVDEIREFFPLLDFTHDSLRSGQIPLWNPYNFSGYPHLANWASAVFYPLHLSMFLLNKLWTFVFLKLTAIILSGFFTYLYLRVLSLDKKAAFFGGLAFAFSAPMLIWGAEIWQSVHSILWLPFILFTIEKIITTRKPVFILLAGFGLASSIMAGYIQPTIYLILTSIAYTLFRSSSKTLFLIITAFIFGFGLASVQILPAVEFFLLAPRREILLTNVNLNFLLPLSHIVTFFVPDIFGHIATSNWFAHRPGQYYEQMIYIGVVPLVLSFFAFFLKRLKKHILFFFILFMISLTSVFNLPTSHLVYNLSIPFLSSAISIRIILITAFSLSVLSAFGLSWWFESSPKDKKRAFFVLIPLISVYVLLAAWLISAYIQKTSIVSFPENWFLVSMRNFVVPGGVFILTILFLIMGINFRNLKQYFYYALVAILLVHSFYVAQKYFSFTQVKFIYPQHPLISYLQEHLGLGRYFGYGEATLVNNFATVYKVYSPEGYDPVNVRRYNELLSSVNTGNFRGIASRSDALFSHNDIYPVKDIDNFRLRLLDLLGVKLVGYFSGRSGMVQDEPEISNDRFSLVWKEDNVMLFQNKKAFQRTFLVPQALYSDSRNKAIEMIYDSKIDLSKNVILEEKITLPEPNKEYKGSANIMQYSPNKVVIHATTNIQQFLVLTDTYFPGWRATINGVPTKIYKADYAFRGILLPPGESIVVFSYQPTSFAIGLFVSISMAILAIALLMWERTRFKKMA